MEHLTQRFFCSTPVLSATKNFLITPAGNCWNRGKGTVTNSTSIRATLWDSELDIPRGKASKKSSIMKQKQNRDVTYAPPRGCVSFCVTINSQHSEQVNKSLTLFLQPISVPNHGGFLYILIDKLKFIN